MRPVVVLLACLLVAGCATTASGPPAAPPTSAAPARPREVRLEGIDPCSLLTPAQRAELGFTSEPAFSNSRVELFRGDVPTCTIHSSEPDAVVLGIGTVTTVGIELWQDPALRADVRPIAVGGFPAVVASPTQSSAYCGVEVDVAAGQLLDVQVLDGGGTPPVAQSELCSRAKRSASELLKTLLTR